MYDISLRASELNPFQWLYRFEQLEDCGSYEVIEALADAMVWRGIPENIRSDNGPEFVAKELRMWLAIVGTRTLYTEPVAKPC